MQLRCAWTRFSFYHSDATSTHATAITTTTMGRSLEENERMLVAGALERTKGNQSEAARLLRIGRDALHYKMKRFTLARLSSFSTLIHDAV